MHTLTAGALPRPTSVRLLLVAAVLFFFYQLPHGVDHDYLILMFPLVAWWGSRMLGFPGLRAWYLDARPGWWRVLALGLALAIAAKFAAVLIGARFGVYTFAWNGGPPTLALAGNLAFVAFGTFVASSAEDILTRGLVLRAFPQLGQRWLFVLVSAVLFVLNHIYRLHKGPAEWLLIFSFGLAYAAALYRTRSLWAAVGLHWGWNLANGLLDLVAQSDVAQPALAPFYSIGAHAVLLGCALLLLRPLREPTAM